MNRLSRDIVEISINQALAKFPLVCDMAGFPRYGLQLATGSGYVAISRGIYDVISLARGHKLH